MGKPKKSLSEAILITAYRIREVRSKQFRTIREAAETFSIMKTLWSQWENAFVKPNGMTLDKLASFFGVPADFFHQKPENWEEEQRKFLAELIARTNAGTKQQYYNAYKASLRDAQNDDRTPPAANKPNGADALGIFLQITRLIADAKAKVMQGEISQDTYDAHMQMLADMVAVSRLTMK